MWSVKAWEGALMITQQVVETEEETKEKLRLKIYKWFRETIEPSCGKDFARGFASQLVTAIEERKNIQKP